MDTIGQSELRMNIKRYFDYVSQGHQVLVPRRDNNNVVIISEAEYNRLNSYKERLKDLSLRMQKQENAFPSSGELEKLCGQKWSGLYECLCAFDGDDSLTRREQPPYEERASL